MQKIEKVKLKNGLEVVFLFDKNFMTSSLQMIFKIGWRNDTDSERGLAHLFEHLVGKRTKKYAGKSEFAKKLDEMGIVSNAWTSPDITGYYQNQTNKNLLPSLRMLFEAIYNSVFLQEDLEKEKEIVMNEAKRYLDNDNSVLSRQIMQNLYPDSTMDKFFFGDKTTMKNINLKHFENFYEIYKNPKNAMLFVGTDNQKNKTKILNFLNQFYDNFENKKLLSSAKILPFKDSFAQIVKFHKIKRPNKEQSSIRLAYKTKKINLRESITSEILRSLLVDGFTGKLMEVLRDQMGLIYGIGIMAGDFHQGVHYAGFSTACDKDKKDLVIKTIKNELKKIQINLTQEEIDRTIPKKEYQEQKPANVADDLDRLIDCVTYKTKYIQTGEYLKILKSIKVKDVKKLIKENFIEKNSSVCVLE